MLRRNKPSPPQLSKADLIITADWHLRGDTPTCRIDDYLAAQARKINFIISLAKQHECPILIAGDVGNKPRWPHWMECWLIEIFTEFKESFDGVDIIVVPGQHDMPQHRLEKTISGSGLGVLAAANSISWLIKPYNKKHILSKKRTQRIVIHGFPFGESLSNEISDTKHLLNIMLAHHMIIENKPLWPGQQAQTGMTLLKQFPDYQLIVTGDNHLPFVAEYEERLLVNPGSLMRLAADQADHKPRVYLWSAESNGVTAVFLPIEEGVVSREHIDAKERHSARLDAFVSQLSNEWQTGVSFEENLRRFVEANQIRTSVLGIINKAIEQET